MSETERGSEVTLLSLKRRLFEPVKLKLVRAAEVIANAPVELIVPPFTARFPANVNPPDVLKSVPAFPMLTIVELLRFIPAPVPEFEIFKASIAPAANCVIEKTLVPLVPPLAGFETVIEPFAFERLIVAGEELSYAF